MRLKSLLPAKSIAFCALLIVNARPAAKAYTGYQAAPPASNGKDTIPVTDTTLAAKAAPQQIATQATFSKDGKVNVRTLSFTPFISVQQYVKGNLAGVYVQEPSGEPGTEQNLFIRGISMPLLSKRELFDNQAAVYLNGVPLAADNPFAYEIQQYDFNRIGPATNLLAALNIDNVESIEVIKDPARLAILGPVAANGAIWITTKAAKSGRRQININGYVGFAPQQQVTPVNGVYENNFRLPFYNKYGTLNDRFNYPAYLKDSSNADYYGRSNWTDSYYKNQALYNLDLSLTGGSERANFRFFGGATRNANTADETALQRYNASFSINVLPLKWVTASAMINATHMIRNRNRNFVDRLAEARYLPDVSNPLPPNKSVYEQYLGQFDENVKDDNKTTAVQGYFNILAQMKGFRYTGGLSFDYNEGTRDVFYPTQLLEGNNFVSNYFGFNQRFIFSNAVGYTWNIDTQNKLDFEAGQTYQSTRNKFEYAYGYNGPNNFIKLNIVNGDPNATDYLQSNGFDVFYHPSNQKVAIAAFFGKANWAYNDILDVTAVVRRDGASVMQPDNRWYTGYGLTATLDLYKTVVKNADFLSNLDLTASYGRNGKLLSDDRFAGGPNYRSDLSWTGAPTIGSFAGLPGLSRPYNSGWVGYGIPWAYVEQLSAGIKAGFLQNKLQVGIDVYSKTDKDMMLPVPVPAEYGYKTAYASGLDVNNSGVDLTLHAGVLTEAANKPGLSLHANLNYNKNELKALPNGLQRLVINDHLLQVGQPIDAFWVYKNEGIYNTNAEVPVKPGTSQPLTYQGVALKAGDARWQDVNGDYTINEDDKVMVGNSLPKITGGFGGNLAYRSFNLDFNFYFALGHKLLNKYAAQRLDFINTDASSSIDGVKEITFWEKKMDLGAYPMYNPWSNTIPYRLDQDLFLDKASFVKLRSVTLSYNLVSGWKGKGKSNVFKEATVYLTGANLFTITSFKGDDPELVQYNGLYTGAGLPIQRSFILGFKLEL
ncbi:SusC/RagA family TonB-linked outer membrane protein [Paraflavitalea sp. CAU 1676]|uniref:SusC/RagA family TonB-linked outer membrane protein n=1 Tax=Paraflavitalea sp. CAU 1676 TaxID=3032598 RepID=UPI0023DA6985|nr:SusC/RagA family TonB-linked outer membrane protein [Paraflavitalea sp. CAU 1676]MDF2188072.1 SusC/RagA family TonB-linked outer membrane protein [Paraflavitalea sp. CAU 1676]